MPGFAQDLYNTAQPYLTRENVWITLAVLALLQLVWIKRHLGVIRRQLTGEAMPLSAVLMQRASSGGMRARMPANSGPFVNQPLSSNLTQRRL